jgi:predicted peroxiredoxin
MRLRDAVSLALGLIAILATAAIGAERPTAPRDGVLIHVSHGTDDPHRVLMAMNMANLMADDHDVLVYFDIKGVEVVLKDAPDLTYTPFKSSKMQLVELSQKHVVVMACPMCLKAAGKTADDLAAGVQLADKSRFFSFTKGRIITLDY